MEEFRQKIRSYTKRLYEEPISKFFISLRLSPNMVTMLGLVITIVGSYIIFQGNFIIAGVVVALGLYWILSMDLWPD